MSAPARRRASPLGYRDALRWILANDDTSFLDDEDPHLSVTAWIVADIYDREEAEVLRDLDLLKKRAKEIARSALDGLAL